MISIMIFSKWSVLRNAFRTAVKVPARRPSPFGATRDPAAERYGKRKLGPSPGKHRQLPEIRD